MTGVLGHGRDEVGDRVRNISGLIRLSRDDSIFIRSQGCGVRLLAGLITAKEW